MSYGERRRNSKLFGWKIETNILFESGGITNLIENSFYILLLFGYLYLVWNIDVLQRSCNYLK